MSDVLTSIRFLDRGRGDFYRFIPWFCTALRESGARPIADVRLPNRLRAACGRLFGWSLGGEREKLIVCGCHRIEAVAWPWCYRYEIVPMMWDLWPDNYADFKRFLRRNRVRTVLCTASQSVDWINKNCPGVRAVWIPEAADVQSFPKGPKLVGRSIDVLSYGRFPDSVRAALDELGQQGLRCQKGAGDTFDQLTETLRSAKVSICYPLCDTNPQKAQGVETLTQRYWEAMCSGTLIVGRAPHELVEVCGYNPVIEPSGSLSACLRTICASVGDYQELVDRNRACAENCGDWRQRMGIVKEAVRE